MSGNGRITVPGQVGITTKGVPGPNATPAVVQMQGAGQITVAVIGGQSRLEALAGCYAAAGQSPQDAAANAQKLLAECERIQSGGEPRKDLVK